MPNHRKPDHLRQRTNSRPDVVLMPRDEGESVAIPPPSPTWWSVTIQAWRVFWASDLAQMVKIDSDLPALRRLFDYRDEHARAAAKYHEAPIVTGAGLAKRMSAHGDAMMKLERLIAPLEDRFGMTPKSRLQLGITFGDSARSIHELQRMKKPGKQTDSEGVPDDERDDEEDDPRIEAG